MALPRYVSTSSGPEWGSDVIVEALRQLNIDYVALNPGASFRGVHDSIVNYAGNTSPELILCPHEEKAVAIAHGYGRAAGKPMVAFVHDIVGLLHASMAIFNAWLSHDPVLVLGGTGPVDADHRRPWIDWIHTANVQGTAVRDFVKWDDQPASPQAALESLIRAYNLILAEPQGPVYVCFDTDVQEQRLADSFQMPDLSAFVQPTRLAPDPAAINKATKILTEARHPVFLANMIGRSDAATNGLIRLAEGLAVPVVSGGDLFNFPSRHPLYATDSKDELLAEADVVVAFDVYDLQQLMTRHNPQTRRNDKLVAPDAKLIDVSLRHLTTKSWADDHGALYPTTLSIAADTAVALPALADAVLAQRQAGQANADEIETRRSRLTQMSASAYAEAQNTAREKASDYPLHLSTVAQALWDVVKDTDWVIANGALRGWLERLWDFSAPYQYFDTRGGGGLGQGLPYSIGVALANRDKARLTINIQSDGDMLFTPSALWTAVHHRIPMLIVMYNNRTYGNDLGHQATMARTRGRPEENKTIGIDIDDPVVDFVRMARSFGAWAEGPIENASDLRPAFERAKREVMENRRVALIDLYTQVR